jgi:hypothetical protein
MQQLFNSPSMSWSPTCSRRRTQIIADSLAALLSSWKVEWLQRNKCSHQKSQIGGLIGPILLLSTLKDVNDVHYGRIIIKSVILIDRLTHLGRFSFPRNDERQR